MLIIDNLNQNLKQVKFILYTVGKNKKAIAEYISNQLQEDKEMEQMTIYEITDPFKK